MQQSERTHPTGASWTGKRASCRCSVFSRAFASHSLRQSAINCLSPSSQRRPCGRFLWQSIGRCRLIKINEPTVVLESARGAVLKPIERAHFSNHPRSENVAAETQSAIFPTTRKLAAIFVTQYSVICVQERKEHAVLNFPWAPVFLIPERSSLTW